MCNDGDHNEFHITTRTHDWYRTLLGTFTYNLGLKSVFKKILLYLVLSLEKYHQQKIPKTKSELKCCTVMPGYGYHWFPVLNLVFMTFHFRQVYSQTILFEVNNIDDLLQYSFEELYNLEYFNQTPTRNGPYSKYKLSEENNLFG